MLKKRKKNIFARTDFCPFSLPLGIGGWLWVVIVALPDFSIIIIIIIIIIITPGLFY